MVIALLIVLVGLVLYCYVGYPALMALLARAKPQPWLKDENLRPKVSVILAVYNEEAVIEECLKSLQAQRYPADLVEILVGSDGSSDRTNTILAGLSENDPRIKPSCFVERRGKVPVVNDLVRNATGEILLFVDADITLIPDSISRHVRHYADPTVSCVAGQLVYQGKENDGVWSSENEYMSYENRLRMHEALVGSTVGIFGGNYSLRRSDYRVIPDSPICDELFSALQVIEKGKRTVFDAEAVSPESFVRTIKDEFNRKARYAARGFNTMTYFPKLVRPSSGLPSLMVWSHKMLRYLMPFCFILVALIVVLAQIVAGAITMPVLTGLLAISICLLLIGFIFDKARINIPVVSNLYWLSAMNLAFATGTIRFLLGHERKLWAPTSRPDADVDAGVTLHQTESATP